MADIPIRRRGAVSWSISTRFRTHTNRSRTMTALSPQAPDFPPWPQFDDGERTGLIRALEQGQWWRMGGQEVDSFEREFGEYHGSPYTLAVTSGTHALELALEVLGIGPGTEVIVPAFTFISS